MGVPRGLYAAYTKLRQPWLLFAMSIDAYQLLPEWAALTLGRTLPWLELLLGIALAAGFGLRYAAGAASVLLAVFLGVMVRAYVMGMKIDCACFGLGEVISAATLARDGVLLALALTVTVLSRGTSLRLVPLGKPEAYPTHAAER